MPSPRQKGKVEKVMHEYRKENSKAAPAAK